MLRRPLQVELRAMVELSDRLTRSQPGLGPVGILDRRSTQARHRAARVGQPLPFRHGENRSMELYGPRQKDKQQRLVA